MICKHFLFLKILINYNINKNFNSHCKYQLRMKGKKIKETRSWIKEHIRELHLGASIMRGLFGPASTKEASNIPAKNRYRRSKFNSDTIEHF